MVADRRHVCGQNLVDQGARPMVLWSEQQQLADHGAAMLVEGELATSSQELLGDEGHIGTAEVVKQALEHLMGMLRACRRGHAAAQGGSHGEHFLCIRAVQTFQNQVATLSIEGQGRHRMLKFGDSNLRICAAPLQGCSQLRADATSAALRGSAERPLRGRVLGVLARHRLDCALLRSHDYTHRGHGRERWHRVRDLCFLWLLEPALNP
mmetsp:Transcript_31729/g.84468  ORF Transcript_31729/g.84468 Transcript_31729/m.84468 type:complete len:209 (+) Transcript_31729:777-1403(+)